MSAAPPAKVVERLEVSTGTTRVGSDPELQVSDDRPAWHAWVTAPGSWGPDLSPDGERVVYISDRSGVPRAWVGSAAAPASAAASAPAATGPASARLLATGRDHVQSVAWSPDGQWIAVLGAPGGETTRTRVWLVRPDGSDAHRVAGVRSGTAGFGPWLRTGATLPLTTSGRRPEETSSTLLDAATGQRRPLGYGDPFTVLDLDHSGQVALVRVGSRSRRSLLAVDLATGAAEPLSPTARRRPGSARGARPDLIADGSTDQGWFLPDGRVLARTNVGRERFALVVLEVGRRSQVLAVHPGGELDHFAVRHDGTSAVLVWNVAGSSVVEHLDLTTGRRRPIDGGPQVVDAVRFSADGSTLVAAGSGPCQPRSIWVLRPSDVHFTPLEMGTPPAPHRMVTPAREVVVADDGVTIEGWLYRPPGTHGPVPTVIHLHGGPESQERPAYAPLFQALAASGIAVFAPNVRGSTGYGRTFENADNGELRYAAISDVAACALHLLRTGAVMPDQLACMGRSYGGYLTLAALTFYPELFAAGVDVCGMSDLLTFYANTEPWVAAVATTKYGDPAADAQLLAELSPLRRFARLSAPLLAVHGANDRNVPVSESVQAVEEARRRGLEAELMLFPDEGHEIARPDGRLRFVAAVVDFLSRHLHVLPAACVPDAP